MRHGTRKVDNRSSNRPHNIFGRILTELESEFVRSVILSSSRQVFANTRPEGKSHLYHRPWETPSWTIPSGLAGVEEEETEGRP